jgi:hypothetical protein
MTIIEPDSHDPDDLVTEYDVIDLTFSFGPYPTTPALSIRDAGGTDRRVYVPDTGVDFREYGDMITVNGASASWSEVILHCRQQPPGRFPRVALTGDNGTLVTKADFR